MLRLARQYFWWPSIDSDVNAFTRQCATFQINARKRTNARLSSRGGADEFFERVLVDVAYFQNTKLLVLVDALARWWTYTSSRICRQLRLSKHCAGYSSTSDFRELRFQTTAPISPRTNSSVSFNPTTSSICVHLQAITNPMVLKIQQLKFWLDKHANKGELDVQLIAFCLHFNTTPAANGAVPADLIFHKTPRTRLSVVFTERELPMQPKPVYISSQPSILTARHGANTFIDDRDRIVHAGDVKDRPDPSSAPDREPELAADGTSDAPSLEMNGMPALRRSERVRQPPDRYQPS